MHSKANEQYSEFAFFSLLRFVAALILAVYGHYCTHFLVGLQLENIYLQDPVLRYIGYNGGVFVEMFFIISGLLFYRVYRPRILNGLGADRFIVDRMVRLYPTIIITSIYMYCGNAFLYMRTGTQWPDGSLSLWNLCCDILFAGRQTFAELRTLNGVIWYISGLMLCYGLAYVLTLVSKKFDSLLAYALPIFAAMLIWYLPTHSGICSIGTARALGAFFCGVLLGKALEFQKKLTRKQLTVLRVALLAELTLAAVSQIGPWQPEVTEDVCRFYNYLVFPELIMLLYDVKWINRICSAKIVQWGGKISYGMYMWQFPMYLTFHLLITFGFLKVDAYSFSFLALRTVTLLLLASMSYILIEKKLTLLIRRLIAQITEEKGGTVRRA